MVCLGSLEQHHFAAVEGVVDEPSRVDDVWPDVLGVRQQRLDDRIGLDGAAVVDLDQQLVLLVEGRLHLLPQDRLVEDVLDTHPHPVDLVGVGGTDATSGGADAPLAQETFGDLVEHLVVLGDDVGIGADQRVRHLDPAGDEGLQLLGEHVEIHHHAVADHGRGAGVEDPGWQQVHDEGLTPDHEGVTRVVASRVTHTQVDAVPQLIGCFALALVAPLGSDHDNTRH